MEHTIEEMVKEIETLQAENQSLEKDYISVCAENQALNRWIDELRKEKAPAVTGAE